MSQRKITGFFRKIAPAAPQPADSASPAPAAPQPADSASPAPSAPAQSEKREDYEKWNGDTAYAQGILRGMKWKRQGLGYLKKPEFVAKVKAYDQRAEGDELGDVSEAESQGSQASQGAGTRKRYHTSVSNKKRKVQLQGTSDADIWEEVEEASLKVFLPPVTYTTVRREPQKKSPKFDGLGIGTSTPAQAAVESVMDVDDESSDELNESSEDLEEEVQSDEEETAKGVSFFSDAQPYINAKRTRGWLIPGHRGYYCSLCRMHRSMLRTTGSGKGVWVDTPVTAVDKLRDKVTKHEKTGSHKASQAAENSRTSGKSIIAIQEQMVKNNRIQLKKIISSLYFCIQHTLPHTTMHPALAELIAKYDPDLADFTTDTKNATYLSTTIAQQLLKCIDAEVRVRIEERVRKSSYLTCLCDETEARRREELHIPPWRGSQDG